jgi:hypothetical protein
VPAAADPFHDFQPEQRALARDEKLRAGPPSPAVVAGSPVDSGKSDDTSLPRMTLELKDWIGQRFVILPAGASARESWLTGFTPQISANQWAGKIITAMRFEVGNRPATMPLTTGSVSVEFTTESGETLRAEAVNGSVRGIAPVRDIDSARSAWANRSLWLVQPSIATYDPSVPASATLRFRHVGRTAHVVVKDVVPGSQTSAPVRFIVQTDDGRMGFVDVRMSDTNVSRILRGGDASFAKVFYTADPRAAHADWPARVWTAIDQGEVFVGMTAAQAHMSWGEPAKINDALVGGLKGEQWIYADGTSLSLTGDVVSEVHQ